MFLNGKHALYISLLEFICLISLVCISMCAKDWIFCFSSHVYMGVGYVLYFMQITLCKYSSVDMWDYSGVFCVCMSVCVSMWCVYVNRSGQKRTVIWCMCECKGWLRACLIFHSHCWGLVFWNLAWSGFRWAYRQTTPGMLRVSSATEVDNNNEWSDRFVFLNGFPVTSSVVWDSPWHFVMI